MTSEDLKAARKTIGYSQSELSSALDTPKRTIQDWEGGKCRLPGIVGVAMALLIQKDKWVMQAITEKIQRELDRVYPLGIPTARDNEEEVMDDAA